MILDTSSVCGAIDNNLAELIHTVITLLKFGIPILLIIFGMLDFAKGVIASKEDEIKSGQHIFIKRIISAVLVFFVVTIVQLVIGLVDDKNSANESDAWNCANMILNGKTQNSSGSTNNNAINRNNKIEACCNQAGGTLNSNGNNKSCMLEQNKQAEYDKCMNN